MCLLSRPHQVEVLDSLSVKDLVDQISHAEVVPMPGFVYPDGAAQSKAEARRGTSAGASGAVSEEVVAKATAQAVHEALRKLAELMVVMQRCVEPTGLAIIACFEVS